MYHARSNIFNGTTRVIPHSGLGHLNILALPVHLSLTTIFTLHDLHRIFLVMVSSPEVRVSAPGAVAAVGAAAAAAGAVAARAAAAAATMAAGRTAAAGAVREAELGTVAIVARPADEAAGRMMNVTAG
jgi:hypothetical protein